MFGAPFCPSCLACIHICCWTLLVPETTYIPFFATPKRWTDEQVHHLWVWAFDFRRGVGRVGWTHGLLASQLPPKTWKQFWPFFVGPPGITIQKKAPPSQSIRYFQQLKRWVYICLKPRGSTPWSLMKGRPLDIFIYFHFGMLQRKYTRLQQTCFLLSSISVFFQKRIWRKRRERKHRHGLEGTDATRKWMVEW